MRGLEPFELVKQLIELRVRNLRVVVDVVALFVMANRVTELADTFFGRDCAQSYRSRDNTKSGNASSASRSELGGKIDRGFLARSAYSTARWCA